ncbi:MAG: hypothetical protein PHU71_01945 [Candidatus Gracilibacteria bacterium]|nr:hypothetical protein [Candidatus Gracilibacteria bacterium]
MKNNTESWPRQIELGTVPFIKNQVESFEKSLAEKLSNTTEALRLFREMQISEDSNIRFLLACIQSKDPKVCAIFAENIANWLAAAYEILGRDHAKNFLADILRESSKSALDKISLWLPIIIEFDSENAEEAANLLIKQQAHISLEQFNHWASLFSENFGIEKVKAILGDFAETNSDLFKNISWMKFFASDQDFIRKLANQNLRAFPSAVAKYPDNFSHIFVRKQVVELIQDCARQDFRGALNLRGHYRHIADPNEILEGVIEDHPWKTFPATWLDTRVAVSKGDRIEIFEAQELRRTSRTALLYSLIRRKAPKQENVKYI